MNHFADRKLKANFDVQVADFLIILEPSHHIIKDLWQREWFYYLRNIVNLIWESFDILGADLEPEAAFERVV